MNYLLEGTELYNLKQRRNEIINKVIGDDKLALSIYSSDEEVDIYAVVSDCQMMPFFSEKKVVVYENPAFIIKSKPTENELSEKSKSNNNKDLEVLIDYLKASNDTTTLIVYIDKPIDKRTKAFKELIGHLKLETYNQLKDDEFINYVNRDLNDKGISLDNRSKKILFERLPNNLENWKMELEKLSLYPYSFTPEVVEALINKPLVDRAFDLTNALNSRNMPLALSLYREITLLNKSAVAIIGLLAANYQNLYLYKSIAETGRSYAEISSQTGFSFDRLNFLAKDAGRLSSKDILKILNKLAILDQDIKAGRSDGNTGLELFIIDVIRG